MILKCSQFECHMGILGIVSCHFTCNIIHNSILELVALVVWISNFMEEKKWKVIVETFFSGSSLLFFSCSKSLHESMTQTQSKEYYVHLNS